jgi:hypothetical protein
MKIILSLLLVMLVITSCKKDEEEWVWCTDCSLESIAGQYTGTGTYENYDNEQLLTGQTVNLTLKDEGNGNIRVEVGITNLFFMGMNSTYTGTYYIALGSNTQDVNLTLWRKGNKLKITGTAIYYEGTIWVDGQEIRKTVYFVDFEVFPKTD